MPQIKIKAELFNKLDKEAKKRNEKPEETLKRIIISYLQRK